MMSQPAQVQLQKLPQTQGVHLLGEWYDCDFSTPALYDADSLRSICLSASRASRLQVVGDAFHQFEPQGVTGTVLLAESHLAVHTWPESRFVTIDVYVCNYLADNSGKALKLYCAMKAHFRPAHESFSRVTRGRRCD